MIWKGKKDLMDDLMTFLLAEGFGKKRLSKCDERHQTENHFENRRIGTVDGQQTDAHKIFVKRVMRERDV